MIYAISDLHGCYDKYMKMLEAINFGEKDTLYVLGDVIDFGEGGIDILQDVMKRSNVVMLMGDHEQTAKMIFDVFTNNPEQQDDMHFQSLFRAWVCDCGGDLTMSKFIDLPLEEKKSICSFLNKLAFCKRLEVDGQKFFLAHTVPSKEQMRSFPDVNDKEYLLGNPDYELVYNKDVYLVTGHTPTGFIDEKCAGKIIKRNNHVAIDCGAVFGNPLGCICLNTMQEFYVE